MKTVVINLEQEGILILAADDYSWAWDGTVGAFRHERGVRTSSIEDLLRDEGPVLVSLDGVTLADLVVTEDGPAPTEE